MRPGERWQVADEDMLEMSLHRERGPMVVADLDALPRSPPVVAEGSTLPAALVPHRSRAVWLLPTKELQRARLDARGTSPGARKLFLLLAGVIVREAGAYDVPALVANGSLSVDATVHEVERLFEHALAEGPRAESTSERRALLREANQATVAQVRGYFARPWAAGSADGVVRTFLCECGDPRCDLD